MSPFEIQRGDSPVILAFPHTGTKLPPEIQARLNANGRLLADTDWHVDRLYRDLLPEATMVRANFHRYVIDANRDPCDVSLYPGQNTTGLVPLTDFDGEQIWQAGEEPGEGEITARLNAFHRPYHAALGREIERVKARHGIALLYDCHSIRPIIPFLFEGSLPDFNIGTNEGVTCHPALEQAALAVVAAAPGYSHVLNGRFKGGWTTRHYGKPASGVHAIQMELSQATHLGEAEHRFDYGEAKAARLRPVLQALLTRLEELARQLSPAPLP